MSEDKTWEIEVVEDHPEDRSFDREFWQRTSARERWEAAWELVVNAHGGENAAELRLQRTTISSRPASR